MTTDPSPSGIGEEPAKTPTAEADDSSRRAAPRVTLAGPPELRSCNERSPHQAEHRQPLTMLRRLCTSHRATRIVGLSTGGHVRARDTPREGPNLAAIRAVSDPPPWAGGGRSLNLRLRWTNTVSVTVV